MLRDLRSHDLDDNIWIDDLDLCLLNLRTRSAPPSINNCDLLRNSGLQGFEISNPTLLHTQIFQNSWSVNTCRPRSMVLLPLQMFDLSTQVNGPATLFLIDGRDLLRVSRLLISQTSFPQMVFTRSLWSTDTCPPDLMIKDFFRYLPTAHRCVPYLLGIQRLWTTSGLYTDFMDSRHVSFRSHGPYFTSGLHTSAILVLKLKTHFNFPGACDLLPSVHL